MQRVMNRLGALLDFYKFSSLWRKPVRGIIYHKVDISVLHIPVLVHSGTVATPSSFMNYDFRGNTVVKNDTIHEMKALSIIQFHTCLLYSIKTIETYYMNVPYLCTVALLKSAQFMTLEEPKERGPLCRLLDRR